MSDSQSFGFAKLVPGFDFLQNLAKGAGGGLGQLPQMSNWVAPTLNVEELDKRIQELRAVHFWLEQNGKALAATIQALEVQKMTLSTLQGMNLSMNELAESLKLKPEKMAAGFAMPTAGASSASSAPSATSAGAGAAARRTAGGKPGKAARPSKSAQAAADIAAQVDPMQWWGSLSQQFQQIAATALKDVAEAGASTVKPAAASQGAASRKSGPAQAGATSSAKAAKPAKAAKAAKPAKAAPMARRRAA